MWQERLMLNVYTDVHGTFSLILITRAVLSRSTEMCQHTRTYALNNEAYCSNVQKAIFHSVNSKIKMANIQAKPITVISWHSQNTTGGNKKKRSLVGFYTDEQTNVEKIYKTNTINWNECVTKWRETKHLRWKYV